MKIISGNTACSIMQTHQLIMPLPSVCVIEASMAGHVPGLILSNQQYTLQVSAMSVENINIQYACNMMM